MVWGCVTAMGMGRIVKIDGNMDGLLYTGILKDDILGSLKDLGIKKKDVYSPQDNNPKHISGVAPGMVQGEQARCIGLGTKLP
jgi:hypothetical protein